MSSVYFVFLAHCVSPVPFRLVLRIGDLDLAFDVLKGLAFVFVDYFLLIYILHSFYHGLEFGATWCHIISPCFIVLR